MNWIVRSTSVSLVLLAPLLGIACGDDDSEDSADLCASREAVVTSFEGLTQIDVIAEGTDAFGEAFDAFETNIDTLADAAGEEYSDEVAAVRTATDGVSSALEDADDQPLLDTANALSAAMTDLGDSTTALLTAVDSACG